MQALSTIRKDYLVSCLRTQMQRLSQVVKEIEDQENDCEFAQESIKMIEADLRGIRKLCES